MIYIKTWQKHKIKKREYFTYTYKGVFLFGFIPLWIRRYSGR